MYKLWKKLLKIRIFGPKVEIEVLMKDQSHFKGETLNSLD